MLIRVLVSWGGGDGHELESLEQSSRLKWDLTRDWEYAIIVKIR